MFYHQELLRKRDGKFAVLWIAATSVKKLTRRELCGVNVNQSCEEILDFILGRLHPKRDGKGRPRLSLYLSSQLVYGLVKVYNRQRDYLLSDANSTLSSVRLTFAKSLDHEIDLLTFPGHHLVTMPDIAATPGQDLFDPYFGDLRANENIANLRVSYAEQEMWTVESGSVSSPGSSNKSVQKLRRKSLSRTDSPPTTVSNIEEITIKDVENPSLFGVENQFPLVEELPAFDGQEIKVIFEEPVSDVDWVKVLSPRPKTVLPANISSPVGGKEITEVQNPLDVVMTPKEKTPFFSRSLIEPEIRPAPPSPGVTPMPPQPPPSNRPGLRQRPSLTLNLPPVDVAPSPNRRRRLRHLVVDAETQISKAEMKHNLETSADTCRNFVLPEIRQSHTQFLLENPCRKAFRHPTLLHLFQRNRKYGILETDSDRAVPVWSVPELQDVDEMERPSKRRRLMPETKVLSQVEVNEQIQMDIEIQNMQLEADLPPIEIPQDITRGSPEIKRDASISMEQSRRRSQDDASLRLQTSSVSDVDRSIVKDMDADLSGTTRKRKSRSRGSKSRISEDFQPPLPPPTIPQDMPVSVPSATTFGESFQNLSVVHEEKEMEFKDLESGIEPLLAPLMTHNKIYEHFLRSVNSLTRSIGSAFFSDICSPQFCNRAEAAQMFTALLDMAKEKEIEVQQEEPFGEILIRRSKTW